MRTWTSMTPRENLEEVKALRPERAAGMVIRLARTERETASVVEVATSVAATSVVRMVAEAGALVALVALQGKPAAPPAEPSTEQYSIGGTRTTPTSSTLTLTTPGR